jgi:hypothetical protein
VKRHAETATAGGRCGPIGFRPLPSRTGAVEVESGFVVGLLILLLLILIVRDI